jgi:hypothetical protein
MARGTGTGCTTRAGTRGRAPAPPQPAWWQEPSTNGFFRGTKGEEILDWFERHDEVKRLPDGRYRFFHATPSAGECARHGLLRAQSLLESDAKSAAFFAARDRRLDQEKDVTVFTVELWPWQIETGNWAALREDVQVDAAQLTR